MSSNVKRCSKCGECKPVTAFARRAKSADGLQARCRDCTRAFDAARYADPEVRTVLLERNRQWHKDNSERARVRHLERRRALSPPAERRIPELGHKFCGACGVMKPLGDFHNSRRGVLGRAERCRACATASSRAWYAANTDRAKIAVRAWEDQNPERIKALRYAATMAYFARRRGASLDIAPVTVAAIESRRAMWGGVCYLCGEAATAMDHVIPLKSGGLHVPANLRPICRPCNSKKGAKAWRQFVAA